MLNKRILSLLLAIVLVVGLMPTSVFATETGGTTAPTESVPETNGEAIVPQNDEEPVPCDICNVADCGVEHKYCEKCEKYDCGKAHVLCEVCKVEDCGVEHEQCDLCGAYDCDGEHEYCTECEKYNCGQNHDMPCETCGKVDCEGHDVTIPTIPTLPTEPEETTAPTEETTEPTEETTDPTEPEEEDIGPITLEDSGITVEGNIPLGAELRVEHADIDDISEYSPELSSFGNPYKAYNITVLQNEPQTFSLFRLRSSGITEWQPEDGETVSVTMDVGDLGEDGDDMLVYHVHTYNDGTADTELLGPFNVRDGKITFEMTRFSYVLVMNGTVKVDDVDSFYKASGNSTNNHYVAIGVYYKDDVPHLLLGGDHKKSVEVTSGDVTIAGNTIYNAPAAAWGEATSLKIQDSENTLDYTDLLVSSHPYIVDLTLKDVVLTGEFTIFVDWPSANGFDLDRMTVNIIFDDGIRKTVYKVGDEVLNYDELPLGYVPEVEAGQEVIYKIEAANASVSTQSITVDLTDTLPGGVFVAGSVVYSTNEMQSWVSAEGNSITFADDKTLASGDSVEFYVKATVFSDAVPGTYKNTAYMIRTGVTKESSADIIVPQPKHGTLTVTKTVTQEYENDILPEDEFIFTVSAEGGAVLSGLSYTIKETGKDDINETLKDDGTFKLKAGQTITITEVPKGIYTVSEAVNEKDYICYVGGEKTSTVEVEIVPLEDTAVTFENKYTKHLGDLTITKKGIITENDGNAPFVFNVMGGAINMNVVVYGNNSVTIKDLPLGDYTVTEVNGYWRYDINKADPKTQSVTVTAEGASVTVKNTRTKAQWLDDWAKATNNFGGQAVYDSGAAD